MKDNSSVAVFYKLLRRNRHLITLDCIAIEQGMLATKQCIVSLVDPSIVSNNKTDFKSCLIIIVAGLASNYHEQSSKNVQENCERNLIIKGVHLLHAYQHGVGRTISHERGSKAHYTEICW